MQIFVTGSTGLLGVNLVRRLIEEGHTVKAMARSREKAERLLGDTGATIIEGNMLNIEGFAHELAGCDMLFHTAAHFREYYHGGDHWDMLKRVNVQGTIDLLHAADRAGIGRFIYTSSSAVLENYAAGPATDENSAYNPTNENLYMKSKVLAEKAVYEFLKSHDLPVVLVLPGWMIGPWDDGPTAAGQLVMNFLAQRIPSIPHGAMNIVDVRDVVDGMITTMQRGQSGERFVIAGRFTPVADLLQSLEAVTGVQGPRRQLPFPLLVGLIRLMAWTAPLTGRVPIATVQALRTTQNRGPASSARAQRDLEVSFRPLEETLSDTVAWIQEQNMHPA